MVKFQRMTFKSGIFMNCRVISKIDKKTSQFSQIFNNSKTMPNENSTRTLLHFGPLNMN